MFELWLLCFVLLKKRIPLQSVLIVVICLECHQVVLIFSFEFLDTRLKSMVQMIVRTQNEVGD